MDFIQIKGVDVHYHIIGEGCPILYLHGSPADHRSMMSAFELVFEQQTGWAVLDRVGHVSELEQPTLFNVLVFEWLNRVDEYLQLSSD